MNKKDDVVKVDKELMEKVEELIKKNKFLFSNKKQVVNLAIIEFLNSKIPHKTLNFGSYKKPRNGFLNKQNLKDRKKKR